MINFYLRYSSKLNIMQVDILQEKYSIKNNIKLNALEKPNELKNGKEMFFEKKTQVMGTLY
ncbi:hypothetical protein CLV90_2563 [Maribacter spongiicola]|uniref:Uncharacterized protein n=1 Tax=Maribacter spongiicola TaxID=1206753 RepID=A0A4R7K453_9FLAO|nr:hypothetical protein CLV90_2563 [Maribacter spongiicola]